MQYIIYHDKSHEPIEDKFAEILWTKSCEGLKGIELNSKKYIFSSVAKILKEQDYFEQYPDKKPERALPEWIPNQQIRRPSTRAGELMKKGFIQYQKEQNRTDEEAEQKWKDFLQAGVDYKIAKRIKYAAPIA